MNPDGLPGEGVGREPEPLYVYFLPDYHGPTVTTEVRPGLMFDTTPDNRLIGIEVLDYDHFTAAGHPSQPAPDAGLRAALDVHRLAEAIYAADPPEVWIRTSTAAYLERARAIAAQYDPGEDFAGHRTKDPHDCFLMNCRDLGDEVASLRAALAALPQPGERT